MMKVELINLSFSYDQTREILQQLSFCVNPSSLTAVVGPSGCGKSTLLRLIAGILPDSRSGHKLSGSVTIDGLCPKSQDSKPGAVSLMFQEPMLLPNRTIAENIALPLQMLRAPSQFVIERVRWLLDQIGLTEYRNARLSKLSYGMKTRVSLAMALAPSPSLLLLDEPFGSLDLPWRMSLYRTLTAARHSLHCTTILVTHDLREAVLLAENILILTPQGSIINSVAIPLAKPTAFTVSELADYHQRSLSFYIDLEQTVINNAHTNLKPC